MKIEMSAYGVTELTPEEASAISGGAWGWLRKAGNFLKHLGRVGTFLFGGAFAADVITRAVQGHD